MLQALADCKAASAEQLGQMQKALDQAKQDKAALELQMLEHQKQAQVRYLLFLIVPEGVLPDLMTRVCLKHELLHSSACAERGLIISRSIFIWLCV